MREQTTLKKALVDTNVLINDVLYRRLGREAGAPSTNALQYLLKSKRIKTHIASFTLIQMHSTLSKAKLPQQVIRQEIANVMAKHVVIDFTASDASKAMALRATDLEDAMQVSLAYKVGCLYVVTANVKDFRDFDRISVVKPGKVQAI